LALTFLDETGLMSRPLFPGEEGTEPDGPVPSHSKGAAEEDAEVVGEAKYSPDKVGDAA
jgi:hypothetical protein